MRFFLSALFVLVGVASISASLHPFFMEYREGARYFIAEDKQGKPQIVDRLATDPESRFTASTDVIFYLYTRNNPTTGYVLKNGDAASLSGSNFSKNKLTKIIFHGWNNDGNSDVNMKIRDAFLAFSDVNVICVDWGSGANGLYGTAVNNVPLVSTWAANFVDWLVSQGAYGSSFHIMGHSLGGHIAGQTARKVTSGIISYLTAFDPAGPSWGPGTDRIRASDSYYTEVIHTDAGLLGLKEPVGHNDFYPNGGSNMPGCLLEVGCSHGRSYEFFAASLDNTFFQANQCANVDEAINNQCSNISKSYMGGASIKQIQGIFHLTTSSTPPYYLN